MKRGQEREKVDLAVPQEVELVDAVVHALHVLEDVGPRVWRGTKGGHVAGLHTKHAVSNTQSLALEILSLVLKTITAGVGCHVAAPCFLLHTCLPLSCHCLCKSRFQIYGSAVCEEHTGEKKEGVGVDVWRTYRGLRDAHEAKVLVRAGTRGVSDPTVLLFIKTSVGVSPLALSSHHPESREDMMPETRLFTPLPPQRRPCAHCEVSKKMPD